MSVTTIADATQRGADAATLAFVGVQMDFMQATLVCLSALVEDMLDTLVPELAGHTTDHGTAHTPTTS